MLLFTAMHLSLTALPHAVLATASRAMRNQGSHASRAAHNIIVSFGGSCLQEDFLNLASTLQAIGCSPD